MPTDADPSTIVKTVHLVFLSTFWGMQIWVTFISNFVMGSNLSQHTFGFIQSCLFPYYFHIGSACALMNLTIFAMCHPSELLNEEETMQITVFFICVTVSALNSQWFGQVTSDIMAEMHLIEQSYGLGEDVRWFSNKSLIRLCKLDSNYRELTSKLSIYQGFSSFCNLCCITCNGLSLYYMAAHLSAL
ncbi:transmembrane protein 205-like [Hemicordylus capensis]|uniref:transmembrane protein 205-like n=1 Tax=Hemicordylus capensis TaxID=884348 RepID=UPI002303D1C5|nr:transmembrane protein 205-like [Hemicordylus capensis]XP_053099679.1 transmembrane protein 205-like [Hemicordylus capensis]XP_053099680.1 transmembrane protein 205-like [Hemicordylus capensis]XP_053099682.1 transmembrane protein 205-like [Hemicordylus capensis]XP_053099683.1 transmembrane protein 205-like [Hemicordylus capensis]XP_053099684.1 transmembrane protein 205-like [Hemicordylus capensis]XP_053099685.1 transmembrane protein 205-like [Hemicordylus capensis]XP_053099686.1 transmembr